MRKIGLLASAVAVLICCSGNTNPVAAAQPILSGPWNMTFCTNPDKLCNVTVCIEFTRSPNLVNGMPISGTWKLPGVFNNGRWVQYGDLVQLSAAYGDASQYYVSFTGVLDGRTRLGGISFVDAADNGSVVNTGTWRAQRAGDACFDANLPGLISQAP